MHVLQLVLFAVTLPLTQAEPDPIGSMRDPFEPLVSASPDDAGGYGDYRLVALVSTRTGPAALFAGGAGGEAIVARLGTEVGTATVADIDAFRGLVMLEVPAATISGTTRVVLSLTLTDDTR